MAIHAGSMHVVSRVHLRQKATSRVLQTWHGEKAVPAGLIRKIMLRPADVTARVQGAK
jgi:hypothetical protein